MRICYLNHDTNGNTGAGHFFSSFSQAVKKNIPGVSWDILTSENILYPNKLKLLLALPLIRKIIRQCDIVHALDGWPYGVIAALASIGLKKKLIITAIGTGAVQPLHRPLRKALMTWAYRRADQVIAVSSNTKKEILAVIPDLKVDVIPHGVDFEKYREVSAGYQEEAKKLRPYVLSVGTLKKRKGFEYSIEAFAAVAPKFPDLKYVIVGGGPEYESLKAKIENLKLVDRVVFLSNIHHDFVRALYQSAEVFMLLSQNYGKDLEGFGLVFLEAAAVGLPVIATSETGAADAVLNGKNGFLVPQQDSRKAGEALGKILSDQNLKSQYSRASVEFARSMSWDNSAQSYSSIYKTLLG